MQFNHHRVYPQAVIPFDVAHQQQPARRSTILNSKYQKEVNSLRNILQEDQVGSYGHHNTALLPLIKNGSDNFRAPLQARWENYSQLESKNHKWIHDQIEFHQREVHLRHEKLLRNHIEGLKELKWENASQQTTLPRLNSTFYTAESQPSRNYSENNEFKIAPNKYSNPQQQQYQRHTVVGNYVTTTTNNNNINNHSSSTRKLSSAQRRNLFKLGSQSQEIAISNNEFVLDQPPPESQENDNDSHTVKQVEALKDQVQQLTDFLQTMKSDFDQTILNQQQEQQSKEEDISKFIDQLSQKKPQLTGMSTQTLEPAAPNTNVVTTVANFQANSQSKPVKLEPLQATSIKHANVPLTNMPTYQMPSNQQMLPPIAKAPKQISSQNSNDYAAARPANISNQSNDVSNFQQSQVPQTNNMIQNHASQVQSQNSMINGQQDMAKQNAATIIFANNSNSGLNQNVNQTASSAVQQPQQKAIQKIENERLPALNQSQPLQKPAAESQQTKAAPMMQRPVREPETIGSLVKAKVAAKSQAEQQEQEARPAAGLGNLLDAAKKISQKKSGEVLLNGQIVHDKDAFLSTPGDPKLLIAQHQQSKVMVTPKDPKAMVPKAMVNPKDPRAMSAPELPTLKAQQAFPNTNAKKNEPKSFQIPNRQQVHAISAEQQEKISKIQKFKSTNEIPLSQNEKQLDEYYKEKREKKNELEHSQLLLLSKIYDRIQSWNSRDTPPSISELLLTISQINQYGRDDPDGKGVRIEHLMETMTNFYMFGPTQAVEKIIKEINVNNYDYVDLAMFSQIINKRRSNYQECEELSQQVGGLIKLDYEDDENENKMREVYDQLCTFDGASGEEVTVEVFIRITTQEFSNLNTNRIIQTIREFDADEDGIVQYDEFTNLIACLNDTQDQVRKECMNDMENLFKLELKNKEQKENKLRQMYKKATSMNLLASYSISIEDLLEIISTNKDEEGLEELHEIIKKSDENEEGFIDFEEFKVFMDCMFYYKNTLMSRASNQLKRLIGMSYSDEKKEKIKEAFKQICKINIVLESPHISSTELIHIMQQDSSLKKRMDLQKAINDEVKNSESHQICYHGFKSIILKIDQDAPNRFNSDSDSIYEESGPLHAESVCLHHQKTKPANQIFAAFGLSMGGGVGSGGKEQEEAQAEQKKQKKKSKEVILQMVLQLQKENGGQQNPQIQAMYDEYLKQKILDERAPDIYATMSEEKKNDIVKNILGVFGKQKDPNNTMVSKQETKIVKKNVPVIYKQISERALHLQSQDVDYTLRQTKKKLPPKPRTLLNGWPRHRELDNSDEKMTFRKNEREDFLKKYKEQIAQRAKQTLDVTKQNSKSKIKRGNSNRKLERSVGLTHQASSQRS